VAEFVDAPDFDSGQLPVQIRPGWAFESFRIAAEFPATYVGTVDAEKDQEASAACIPATGLAADGFDPVLEVFKRDIDFTLVEKNLRLTIEQRAQQLVNATRFLRKFRPLVPIPER
jgi:hypothetical protein